MYWTIWRVTNLSNKEHIDLCLVIFKCDITRKECVVIKHNSTGCKRSMIFDNVFWVSLCPSTPPNKNGLPVKINRSIWPTTSHVRTWKCGVNYAIHFSKKYAFELGYHGGNIYIFLPEYEKVFQWENKFKRLSEKSAGVVRRVGPHVGNI